MNHKTLIPLIDIKLSTFGFATYCDFCFCNRIQKTFPNPFILDSNILKNIKYGDKCFLNWSQHQYYLPQLLQELKSRDLKVFFIILHEPFLRFEDYLKILPFSIHILTTNNWLDNQRVHNLPIGIRDGEEIFSAHNGFSQKLLLKHMRIFLNNNNNNELLKKERNNKNILCLLCFTLYNWCAEDRTFCYEVLNNKWFVENLNAQTFDSININSNCGQVPLEVNYEKTKQSHFVLCPTGLGQATHRFFETILLGSIPIVKKTGNAFDKLYSIFPCLVVDDWYQVTEQFLFSKKDECYILLDNFYKKYPNFYNDIELLFDLTIQYL